MNDNKPSILLVEDSAADQIVIQRALEDEHINCSVYIAENGEIALNYLNKSKAYPKNGEYISPDLVLLDINMPNMDGLTTLKTIRRDVTLRSLPIIMFTTSNRKKDILECYESGANAYLVKPAETAELANTVKQIEQFWFGLVALPKTSVEAYYESTSQ